jgi:protocatechuate 3,4-dioxygenase beta subunit
MSTTAQTFHIPVDRRRFFKSMAIASGGFMLPGFLAEALTVAPTVTQGPYCPLAKNIPLDKDNDLGQLNDNLTLAADVITHITGRVLDTDGDPIKGALVELWHADREGDHLYSASATRDAACDTNFTGFGQFLTDADGAYRFRTVKAGLYRGRTRHCHGGSTLPGQKTRITTQTAWNETAVDLTGATWDTQNSNDSVFSTVSSAAQRAAMLLNFNAVPGTATGEVQAAWDYVVRQSRTEPTYPDDCSLVGAGVPVAGPGGGNGRFKLSLPAYTGYSYEIYGNPTFVGLGGSALPFSLSATGTIDRNIHTATGEGALAPFVEQKAVKGFYYVAFPALGVDTGTP